MKDYLHRENVIVIYEWKVCFLKHCLMTQNNFMFEFDMINVR